MNSFIACNAFCPGPPNCDPWTPRNYCVCTSQAPRWRATWRAIVARHRGAPRWRATMARHAWHVDKAPAKIHKNRNALRSSIGKTIACLYGLRCELVNVTRLAMVKEQNHDQHHIKSIIWKLKAGRWVLLQLWCHCKLTNRVTGIPHKYAWGIITCSA